MLPVVGVIFGALWLLLWKVLTCAQMFPPLLRGFVMMVLTLALTGGLHLDGLMDTCDAIFSHQDRETRLRILSDTHAGSFAVMGCVIVLMAKTLVFAELLTLTPNPYSLFFIPVFSRLGMAFLLNTLPFAKDGGLAVMLGGSRRKKDNIFLVSMMILLCLMGSWSVAVVFVLCLMLWRRLCMHMFGGITGDLLGAFVEASEVMMMFGMVIEECM